MRTRFITSPTYFICVDFPSFRATSAYKERNFRYVMIFECLQCNFYVIKFNSVHHSERYEGIKKCVEEVEEKNRKFITQLLIFLFISFFPRGMMSGNINRGETAAAIEKTEIKKELTMP